MGTKRKVMASGSPNRHHSNIPRNSYHKSMKGKKRFHKLRRNNNHYNHSNSYDTSSSSQNTHKELSIHDSSDSTFYHNSNDKISSSNSNDDFNDNSDTEKYIKKEPFKIAATITPRPCSKRNTDYNRNHRNHIVGGYHKPGKGKMIYWSSLQ